MNIPLVSAPSQQDADALIPVAKQAVRAAFTYPPAGAAGSPRTRERNHLPTRRSRRYPGRMVNQSQTMDVGVADFNGTFLHPAPSLASDYGSGALGWSALSGGVDYGFQLQGTLSSCTLYTVTLQQMRPTGLTVTAAKPQPPASGQGAPGATQDAQNQYTQQVAVIGTIRAQLDARCGGHPAHASPTFGYTVYLTRSASSPPSAWHLTTFGAGVAPVNDGRQVYNFDQGQ